jgi:hypothetical protein
VLVARAPRRWSGVRRERAVEGAEESEDAALKTEERVDALDALDAGVATDRDEYANRLMSLLGGVFASRDFNDDLASFGGSIVTCDAGGLNVGISMVSDKTDD